jgi:DNA-binding transcriptional regulator GbsR (MarR family)
VNRLNGEIQEKLAEIEELFVENIAENMRTYGISATVGRVLGIIYMNHAPMNLDQLSESTGMSKTRMSQVVREMVDYNIANKVFEKGVRKDMYTVEQDYYQTFISLFSSSWQKVIKKNKRVGRKVFQELIQFQEAEGLDEATGIKVNELLEETKQWLDYYEWLDRLIEFIDSGEVFKHVPK